MTSPAPTSPALDPNELHSPEQWVNDPSALALLNPPQGVDVSDGSYYANVKIYNNGRRVIEWYKRGNAGAGAATPDAVVKTVPDTIPDIAHEFGAATARAAASARADQGGVTREGATRGPKNGPQREVYRNGEWVTEDNPLYQGSTADAAAKNAAALQAQREKNAAWPAGQDPMYETDAERAKRAEDRIRQQGIDANTAADNRRADATAAATAAQRNKPEQAADGSWGYWDQTSGTPTWTPITGGPAAKKYTEVKQDPNTGAWSGFTADGKWEPIKGGPGVAGNQPLPPGMPPFRPDPSKPAMGLTEYTEQLQAMRSQRGANDAPLLTDAQAAQAAALAHQSAIAEAGRLDTIVRAQQTAQANEVSQRNADLTASTSRLTAANTATQNALETSQKMAGNFTPSSYAKLSGPLLPTIMGLQDTRAALWGGLDQPARIGAAGYPAIAQVGQMGLNAPAPTGQDVEAANRAAQAGFHSAVAPLLAPQPAAVAPAPTAPLLAPHPVVPAQPPAAVAPTATPLPPGRPDQMQAAPQIENAINPPQAAAPAPVAGPADTSPIFQPGPHPYDPSTMVPAGPYQDAPYNADPSQGPVGATLDTPAYGAPQMAQAAPPQQQGGILPANIGLGVMATLHASGKYPPGVVQEAARQLGWL